MICEIETIKQASECNKKETDSDGENKLAVTNRKRGGTRQGLGLKGTSCYV